MARSQGRMHVADAMVPATSFAPGEARAAIASIGRELPTDLVSDAILLVSELVTNCVRHAGGGPDSRVLLQASASTEGLRVEVHDWGPGFEIESPPTPKPDRGSGFGLYLVQRLASRWGLEEGPTTCVWFELDAPRAT